MAEHNNQVNPGEGYEVKDARPREIITMGAGVAIGTLLIALAIWGLFNAIKTHDSKTRPLTPTPVTETLPPGPHIEEHPDAEYKVLRKHEDTILNTYGWVDKNAKTVRIPIDQAIDIMAQRGLPTRPPGAPISMAGANPTAIPNTGRAPNSAGAPNAK